MLDVWDIMSSHLYTMNKNYGAKIHLFVLMSNHYHAIISTPQANIDEAMWYFNLHTSKDLTSAGNRLNQTYGNRYFKTVLSSHHYYLHAYKYFYLNPVKAGIVSRAEDYLFSSLHGLLGRSHLFIPVEEDLTLFDSPKETLKWINAPVDTQDWLDVGNALRKPVFKLRKTGRDQKSHLEKLLL